MAKGKRRRQPSRMRGQPDLYKRYKKREEARLRGLMPTIKIPKGYHLEFKVSSAIKQKVLWLVHDESGYEVMLTNRHFGKDIQATPTEKITCDVNRFTKGRLEGMIGKVLERKPHARILDVGCGFLGQVVYDIAERYGDQVSVAGIDFCVSTQYPKLPNLSVVQGNVLHLPFSDDAFDVVLSYQVLRKFSFEDCVRAMDGILRVMEPSAHALIDLDALNDTEQRVLDYYGDLSGSDVHVDRFMGGVTVPNSYLHFFDCRG